MRMLFPCFLWAWHILFISNLLSRLHNLVALGRDPMNYRLSSKLPWSPVQCGISGPILWCGGHPCNIFIPHTGTWSWSLCPCHSLRPWYLCIQRLPFINPELILVHQFTQPLRAWEILATFSVTLWSVGCLSWLLNPVLGYLPWAFLTFRPMGYLTAQMSCWFKGIIMMLSICPASCVTCSILRIRPHSLSSVLCPNRGS